MRYRRTSLVGEIALTLPGSLKVANHSTLSAMASAPTLPHPWENRC
ncbi:MAG: hypothetical protein HYX33_03405 [Actinobacteria bacterium]|nr:hypothetical protein [Actinomycetota bacterium]